MAKHKSLKDAIREREFRKMIADSLRKQYQRGLLIGSRTMLKVIGDEIAKDGTSAEEKLTAVMKVVNNLLGMTEKTAEAEQGAIENPEKFIFENLGIEPEEAAEAAPGHETVEVPDPEEKKE